MKTHIPGQKVVYRIIGALADILHREFVLGRYDPTVVTCIEYTVPLRPLCPL